VVDQLYDAIERLHADGLTLLLAEQSVPMALQIADYAYVLQTGRTVLQGPAETLENDPQVRRIYLGIDEQKAGEAPLDPQLYEPQAKRDVERGIARAPLNGWALRRVALGASGGNPHGDRLLDRRPRTWRSRRRATLRLTEM
jgi:ABC-type multidrug transport system ATPase subunit